MKESITIVSTICVIILLVSFTGVFFGLNYPEIVKINNYLKHECNITQKLIEKNYNVWLECKQCVEAEKGKNECPFELHIQSEKDPELCLEDETQCSEEETCNNGYMCCSECCDTCTDNSGTSKKCNCRCCQSTERQECQVKSEIWYSLIAEGYYIDKETNEFYTFNYIVRYQTRLEEAQLEYNNLNSTYYIECWSDPNDPNYIIFENEYTIVYWIITAIIAGLFLIFLLICLLSMCSTTNKEDTRI